MRIIGNDQARFDSYVAVQPSSGCWLWIGALDSHDYGHFWMRGEVMKAHRASWMLHKGEIPEGLWVLHRCDVPGCVNPEHLFLGDRTANMQDMAAKGRQVFQIAPEKVRRGERSIRAKLSDSQAVVILHRLSRGERGSDLAREYGVSKATISAMKVGRNWAHLANQRAEIEVEPMTAQQADIIDPPPPRPGATSKKRTPKPQPEIQPGQNPF